MAKVLLIEDDRYMAATVEKMLSQAGYEVTRVENGVSGLESFAAFQPDIVITDIVMPDQDGLETIAGLLKLTPDFPILAVSGGGRTGHTGFLAAARKAGAVEVLAKPFRLDALLSAVARCLSRGKVAQRSACG